jgi:hypothetical protein
MDDTQSTANSDRKMLFTVVQHNCFDMPTIKALNQATVAMAKEQRSQGASNKEKGKAKAKAKGKGKR